MKRCPTCQSTYTDDSLRFCLQDGSPLVSAGDTPGALDADRTQTHQNREPPSHEPPATEILDMRVAPTARPPAHVVLTDVIRSRETLGPERGGGGDAAAASAPPPLPTAASRRTVKIAMIAIAALLSTSIVLGLALWLRPSSSEANRNTAGSDGNRRETDAQNNGRSSSTTTQGRDGGAMANNIRASASSTRRALAGNTYEPGNVLDGRLMTAWAEGVGGDGIGEWLRCDFAREVTLKRIAIAPGYFKSPQIWARNNRVAAATFYFSDGTSRQFRFPDRMEEQILEVGEVKTGWVRIVIDEVYSGTDADTSISQLAFE